jgi:hypothetical protein
MRVVHSLAAIAAFAGVVGAAHAQSLTRDEVRGELVEAQRTGDILAPGDSGLTLRELYPHRYPAPQFIAAPKTRAQVVAELKEAVHNGDVLVGDSGMTERDLHPQDFPARAVAQGKTRQQVRAELAEAIRTGDIVAAGESGQTLREQHPQRYAKASAEAAPQTVAKVDSTSP